MVSMSKKAVQAAGILLAAGSVAAVTPSEFAGKYELKEVWNDQGDPLPLPSRNKPFILELSQDGGSEKNLRLSVKISNNMSAGITLEDTTTSNDDGRIRSPINIGFVMSTRMYAANKELRDLETYLSSYLPQMISMEKNDEELLVLASDPDTNKARIVCESLADEVS